MSINREAPAVGASARPAIERQIIERYATNEDDLDDGLELLSTADLVDHLAFSMGELEDAIKRTTDPKRRAEMQETLDQVIADAEALIAEHTDQQLSLFA